MQEILIWRALGFSLADIGPLLDDAALRAQEKGADPCPVQMHRNLGEMHVGDPRFAATYEQQAVGLAAYVRDAIDANAASRAGVSR